MSRQPEEDLSCPICHEIFTDPVLLLCSHSVCKDCLETWWNVKIRRQCPVCKAESSQTDPPRNLALKNLCENLSKKQQKGSEPVCSLHSEKLKLFCLDHQELVCYICRDSERHDNHRIRPVEEISEDHREELRKSLKPLQDKLESFKRRKVKFDQTADHIKVQAQNTKRQMSEEFEKLHQFLKEEEEVRMKALMKEEEQKTQTMKMKMESLNKDMSALSDIIRSSEEKLKADDASFLQNYQAAISRVQQHHQLEDPQLTSGALIDVVKHLGNLSYNIWKKMKDKVSYSPVILDPNTASPNLIVCDDLTTVRRGWTKNLPNNPERVQHEDIVLGSQCFTSGIHCWDVDVSDNDWWGVGVMEKSDYSTSYREIRFSDGSYTAHYTKGYMTQFDCMHLVELTVNERLTRVRVHLDCDKKTLSFHDPETSSLIHTFSMLNSKIHQMIRFFIPSPPFPRLKNLFPYIRTKNQQPVRISPLSISTAVEQLTVTP